MEYVNRRRVPALGSNPDVAHVSVNGCVLGWQPAQVVPHLLPQVSWDWLQLPGWISGIGDGWMTIMLLAYLHYYGLISAFKCQVETLQC